MSRGLKVNITDSITVLPTYMLPKPRPTFVGHEDRPDKLAQVSAVVDVDEHPCEVVVRDAHVLGIARDVQDLV